MTELGTILEGLDEIPADVTGMFDRDDDPWFRLPTGHWHATTESIRRCLLDRCPSSENDPMEFAPLYVAAVRS